MKAVKVFGSGMAAAVSLSILQGCALSTRPKPVLRYDIPCAKSGEVSKAGEAAQDASRENAAFAVGKVRAASDIAGRALRAVDTASGRSAPVSGWDLASPPEAVVARSLRRFVEAGNPGALVFDASMPPRGTQSTLVECWIETFRVEKRDDGWFFAFKADVYETAHGGKTEVRRVASEVKISGGGREPPPGKVVLAIGEAMKCLAPQ